ncbi:MULTISPECIES: hypothetical protein [Stenotrophomonas]|uniref:hypothetical protein n=1 Tax=Stenotrophomonas TaxID=40323 RepID=UPI000D0DB8B8|nr:MULTISPECIES: hypothetical protein [Stenotrophomonas]PSM15609.1 hypothetical protein CV100_00275 [Stenotrophomonas maltophilia]
MMLLPILLLCAVVAVLLGATVTAAVAMRAGVRRFGLILVLLSGACLNVVSFFAGYDSPLFDPLAVSSEELAAQEAKFEAMAAHRARLEPAIEQDDPAPLLAALEENAPTLSPAKLLCLVRTNVIEGKGSEGLPAVSEARHQFLQAVAEAAWSKALPGTERRAIGLLALDAALRHGTSQDVEKWLDRGVDPRNVDWARQVTAFTEPAGMCRTFERWPLSTLEYNERDPDRKRDLLLKHGVNALANQ